MQSLSSSCPLGAQSQCKRLHLLPSAAYRQSNSAGGTRDYSSAPRGPPSQDVRSGGRDSEERSRTDRDRSTGNYERAGRGSGGRGGRGGRLPEGRDRYASGISGGRGSGGAPQRVQRHEKQEPSQASKVRTLLALGSHVCQFGIYASF